MPTRCRITPTRYEDQSALGLFPGSRFLYVQSRIAPIVVEKQHLSSALVRNVENDARQSHEQRSLVTTARMSPFTPRMTRDSAGVLRTTWFDRNGQKDFEAPMGGRTGYARWIFPVFSSTDLRAEPNR